MKILVVCQYYYPEPFRITDVCESLVHMGHDVTVLTGLPNYPEGHILDGYRNGKKRAEVLNGVKIYRCFELGRGNNSLKLFLNYLSFAVSGSLKAFFIKDKFDVVFVNQLSPVMMGIPAMIYRKKNKKKILLYCLDLWPDSLVAGGIKEGSIIYNIFKIISKWIYNSADSIAVTSSMFIDYFNNKFGINKQKIFHLPQYAEDIFTESVEVEKDDKNNFVFAGNIGEMQSIETIVKAANELRNQSNIIFHIVGDGSKLEDCKILAKELELDNIIYYGRKPVSEMPYFYGLADAMLLTLKNNKTISYTLPGKIQSYMAAGKPIIAAINGEANRVIKEADCGLCCEAENHIELATIIKQFCESNRKKIMAQNSNNYYLKNYSKEQFMKVLEYTLINMEE